MAEESFGKRLGALIKSERESAGLGQQELMETAFSSTDLPKDPARLLRSWENGEVADPQARRYKPVCKVLGIDAATIEALKSGTTQAPNESPAPYHAAPQRQTAPISINVPGGRKIIGREEDLQNLRDALVAGGEVQVTNSGAILAGQGGIGKSTLARGYVERFGGTYDGVLWANAATRSDLRAGLANLCIPLGLPLPPDGNASEPVAQAVLATIAQRTATGERWLFVYDNVETDADFQGLVPQGAHLIATTRQGTGWPGFTVLPADKLGYDSADAPAVRLLIDTATASTPGATWTPGTAAEARELAAALDGLPLALVMAGRLIAQDRRGYADYLTDISEIIAREPVNDGYPTSVIGAVRLSYDALSDDARWVADIFAWYAPEGLEARLITDAPEGEWWPRYKADVPPPLQDFARNPARVRAALAALLDRSLLTPDAAGYAMHRMTAAALRAMQAERGEDAASESAAALLDAVYPGGTRNPGHSPHWPECRRLTPHVLSLWRDGAGPKTPAMEGLLNQAGIYLGAIAEYALWLPLTKAALDLAEARLPEADRLIAIRFANLGTAHLRHGDFAAAEAALQRAVDLHETHRPGSDDLADSYSLLGYVLRERGRRGDGTALTQAVRRRQQALALRRRLFGRHCDPVAEALNNLGTVRGLQGRHAAAGRLYRAALTMRRDLLETGDTRLALSAMSVGSNWLELGQADRAEPLLREALASYEAALDEQPQHPDRRDAAGWLISCLLVRARAGEDPEQRRAQATDLCAAYGVDLAEREEHATRYPYTPPPPDP